MKNRRSRSNHDFSEFRHFQQLFADQPLMWCIIIFLATKHFQYINNKCFLFDKDVVLEMFFKGIYIFKKEQNKEQECKGRIKVPD
jgi:hypothetical protein